MAEGSRALCILRCTGFDLPTRRLAQVLRPVFGDRLVLAMHQTGTDAAPLPPEDDAPPVVPVTEALVAGLGLPLTDDWGWRCGDYFQIAVARACPDFDHYWMVEPDVWFNFPDPARFFDHCAASDADFLAADLGRRGEVWVHHRAASAVFDEVWGCLYPLTRLSRRAIEAVLADRLALGRTWNATPAAVRGKLANDESFVASCLQKRGLQIRSLQKVAPQFLAAGQRALTTDRVILWDRVGQEGPHVLHPVVPREVFFDKMKARLKAPRLDLTQHYADTLRDFGTEQEKRWFAQRVHRMILRHCGLGDP